VLKSADIRKRAEEVLARCGKLACFSESQNGTCRTFLSPPMRDCHREIGAWLKAAGAAVTVDPAGNLRGFYPAAQSGSARLLLGSHLDTVPNAGPYDGVLGVLIAVALLETLQRQSLPFAIEVVGFSEEEGVRFGTPFIGSRALVGKVDDQLLNLQDKGGISVRRAIENFGLNPTELASAVLSDDILAYLEFHIEQGPVLESLDYPLAAVEAIAGQTRMELVFMGRANHAGTTPMHLRHDALAAAAEWIVTIEHTAQKTPDLVATVGRVDATPGATNVIAGEVRATLDVRHKSDNIRERTTDALIENAQQIAERRGLRLHSRMLLNQPAVAMDSYLLAEIEQAIRMTGSHPHRMVSGAGHDAMILAEKVPAGMIFLRTPGGISHDPGESVHLADVAKAIDCGLHLLDRLAHSSHLQQRMSRA
jgi:allantoate deiminase